MAVPVWELMSIGGMMRLSVKNRCRCTLLRSPITTMKISPKRFLTLIPWRNQRTFGPLGEGDVCESRAVERLFEFVDSLLVLRDSAEGANQFDRCTKLREWIDGENLSLLDCP